MKEKLATLVLIACALFLGLNICVSLYHHMFVIPQMLIPGAFFYFYDDVINIINDLWQKLYFWIPLNGLILLTLILSTIFNWSNPKRKKLVLAALGIYLYTAVVSIYFEYQWGMLAAIRSNTEFLSQTRQWLMLSWHRPVLQIICEVILLIAISKPKVKAA